MRAAPGSAKAIVRPLRTLLISDLHLGIRRGHDVLRHPAALDRLLAALEDVDRLILLGDVVELVERRPTHAMHVAEPMLRAIGARMRGREIHLVPGNHDHALVREWAARRGDGLEISTPVPLSASPLLERVAAWLSPSDLSVSYPGLQVSDAVWVSHGHHLNRHLLPTNAIGLPREWLGRPSSATRPGDYERRGTDARATRLLKGPVGLMRRLIDPQIAPLTAWLLSQQMRRAALPAMRRVVQGFGVEAQWVVFGHVHRLGPLPSDDGPLWRVPGAPALINTGSWLYEPLLVRHARPPHPYWPGGAVLIEPGGEPQAIGLLDDLGAEELAARPAGPRRLPRAASV